MKQLLFIMLFLGISSSAIFGSDSKTDSDAIKTQVVESSITLTHVGVFDVAATLTFRNNKLIKKDFNVTKVTFWEDKFTTSPPKEDAFKSLPQYTHFPDGELQFGFYDFNGYKYAELYNKQGKTIRSFDFLNKKYCCHIEYESGCLYEYTSEGESYGISIYFLNPEFNSYLTIPHDQREGLLSNDRLCFTDQEIHFVHIFKNNQWADYRLQQE